MTRFLLFSIRFLDDRYHGLTDNGEKAEWPPSPFRVFLALVAGNARGPKLSESIRSALRWLESLDPPDIIAPQAQQGRVSLTYVLNNTPDRSRAPKTAGCRPNGGVRAGGLEPGQELAFDSLSSSRSAEMSSMP